MNKKYNIIYADPPWNFKTWSKKGKEKSAEKHYKTMSKEEIQNIDVAVMCKDDAVLLLWVTAPCLEEGLELIKKWGFTYKTKAFCWVKIRKGWFGFLGKSFFTLSDIFFGMGYYTRANTEDCLLATRGKPLKRHSKAVRQVIISKIREHSRKPDETRNRIVQLFGDVPRLEMFARTKTNGWDVLGNETDKFKKD